MKRFTIAAALAFIAVPAAAQLAVSANDNKVVNIAGVNTVVPNAAPDSVSVIDMSVFPPRLLGEVQAPTSVVGPPSSVAVAPDESFALVSWSQGAAFTPDSGTLLVQNMVEKDVMVFKIEFDQLRDTWHRIKLSGGGAGIGTAR